MIKSVFPVPKKFPKFPTSAFLSLSYSIFQKQPSRVVRIKRCSENMQQIYRRAPMPKCDFNKVAKQLYWNRTSLWVFFPVNLLHIFRTPCPKNTSGRLPLQKAHFMNVLSPSSSKLSTIGSLSATGFINKFLRYEKIYNLEVMWSHNGVICGYQNFQIVSISPCPLVVLILLK